MEVNLPLRPLVDNSAHFAAIVLLVVVHKVFDVGDDTLGLDASHYGRNHQTAQIRVLAGKVPAEAAASEAAATAAAAAAAAAGEGGKVRGAGLTRSCARTPAAEQR